jgi:anti-sigma-K factor RskA
MTGHPSHDEDFDLYALGALDGTDLREFEEHVRSCADCGKKLAEARGRVAMLAFSAPEVAPSAMTKIQLMDRVRHESGKYNLMRPATEGEVLGGRSFSSDTKSVSPSGALAPEGRVPSGISRWWAGVLVPAAAALAILTLVLWQKNEGLDQQIAALHTEVASQQQQIDSSSKLATLIGSSDTVTVNLAPQPGMPKGAAHVMYNMKMGMLMYDGQLESAPAGKSYQLWVVPQQGNPISAGVFQPVPGQMDHWMMDMPAGVVPKEFAVTLEPSGGMSKPTGPMVLVGAAS